MESIFQEQTPESARTDYKGRFGRLAWGAVWPTYWSAWFRNAEQTTFNLPSRDIERSAGIQVRMYPEYSFELGKIVGFVLNKFPNDPWVQAWREPEDAMEQALQNGGKYPPEIPNAECVFGPFNPSPQEYMARVENFANQEMPDSSVWKHN